MENQKTCEHTSINRVLDGYLCNRCGAEFVPKDPKLANPWKDQCVIRRNGA